MLVDDHSVVRTGYRRLIETTPGFQVVAEGANADEAYALYKAHVPDAVVMDIMLPGASGIDVTRRIVAYNPAARVLVFSMYSHAAFAQPALEAGALGFITKDSEPEELIEALATIAAGKRYLSRAVAQMLAFSRMSARQGLLEGLAPREFEICRLLLSGTDTDTIAQQLKLSPKTVANRISHIRRKLNVGSDIELVRVASEVGLVPWVDRPRSTETDEH
jgi:DNA-binding NarL/FixJ family response regulator